MASKYTSYSHVASVNPAFVIVLANFAPALVSSMMRDYKPFGVATHLFLSVGGSEKPTHDVSFDIAPRRDGGAVGLSDRF